MEWHDSVVQGHILIVAMYLIPGTQNMPLYLIPGLEKMQGHRTEQSTHCALYRSSPLTPWSPYFDTGAAG